MKTADVVIVDYGVGNVASVQFFLKSLGYDVICSNDQEAINGAKVLILPGVGAFNAAMSNIKSSHLFDTLQSFKKTNRPIIGICLGMQLLAESSTEIAQTQGFGWIPGTVKHLQYAQVKRVPHIGWSDINYVSSAFNNWGGELEVESFYFDHSFYFEADPQTVVATVDLGTKVPCIVRKHNVIGIQFHPEKSQLSGKILMVKILDEFDLERDELWL